MVRINGINFEVVEDVKDGWNEEEFKSRYSEVLNKYDYIVGDWGYEQLRLRGFFDDKNRKSSYDTKISTLPEYLYEYCNFGCAYFVVKKVKEQSREKAKA
ncbi:YutD family protein [Desertibacillus haloalkaliphilus]|uniref:YutD family protein n=1 Tax=Desertibacillus haloalkaliphilus TaxID=1328930 RepID=UPI001C277667|nr:YutD family protein [Desertibacillus haloalkaliphilus]MBU8906571.1 YutD family protein [Desertibacillus haloalkaliphilus]